MSRNAVSWVSRVLRDLLAVSNTSVLSCIRSRRLDRRCLRHDHAHTTTQMTSLTRAGMYHRPGDREERPFGARSLRRVDLGSARRRPDMRTSAGLARHPEAMCTS